MKIEMHAHTSEVSECGKMPAEELIRRYAEAGYGAVVITDHLIGSTSPQSTCEERAKKYLTGYHAAREAGEKYGVHVLLGAEARFPSRSEDILIYGLEESDMERLIDLLDAEPGWKAFHEALKQRGLLEVQAHPFRPNLTPIPHEYLDGSEVYNGNARHNSHYEEALRYGEEGGANFIRTSGSDAHQVEDMARGGLISSEDITCNRELLDFLRRRPHPERIETHTGFRWQQAEAK